MGLLIYRVGRRVDDLLIDQDREEGRRGEETNKYTGDT